MIRYNGTVNTMKEIMILLIILVILQGVLSTCGNKICARTTTGSSTISWWTESEPPSVNVDVGRSTNGKPCWYWIDTSLFLLKIKRSLSS